MNELIKAGAKILAGLFALGAGGALIKKSKENYDNHSKESKNGRK